MKKSVAVLSLFVLLFSANLAFADHGHGEQGERVKTMAKIKLGDDHEAKGRQNVKINNLDESQFVVIGEVKSVSGSQFTINAGDFHKRFGELEGDIVIKTDANTKISMLGDSTTLSNVQPGFRVIVKGERSGSDFVADWVQVKGEYMRKAFGEVTAKTESSITITNNLTGDATTVNVDDETKVMINGEAKTLADVEVGDKGRVKIKAMIESMVAKFINLFR